MVISQPPGNNPSYYRTSLYCLNCSRWLRHLMFYTCRYTTSEVTHSRNGAIKHIFYTNQIHGGIISRLFFIHLSLHALALHQQFLKYYFKSFCMKIWQQPAYICQLYFPPECQQDALCYATNTIK